MYILYVDHSGEIMDPNETYFVMGAIGIFERQVYFLEQHLNELQRTLLPETLSPIEFHANHVHQGRGAWQERDRNRRMERMRAIYQELAATGSPKMVILGQAIQKSCVVPRFSSSLTSALAKIAEAEMEEAKATTSEQRQAARRKTAEGRQECGGLIAPILRKGLEGLCTQFEFFLRKFYDSADPDKQQRGLMIFDHASYEREFHVLMQQFRAVGTHATEVRNILDVPLFADSASSRMVQAADFVSYALYRRYERKDTEYFDIIAHRFDESNGVIHGLSHVTSNASCMCPACVTRRLTRPR